MAISRGNLNGFFFPKSVAIFGASDNKDKVGGILLKKALNSKVKVVPINPKYPVLLGNKCYKNISDYKDKIDLAVIAIPSNYVIKSLEECGKKGIKNVIIISSGFSEIGNTKITESLNKIAKINKIRFIGSNCFGICNPKINLDLTFSSSVPHSGNIAFISQSGALWSYISDLSAEIKGNFGFSSFVSLGNMENLNFNDFIKYFGKEKNTKSIILYIESLRNGDEFIKIAKKISKSKKIFAVKGGSSTVGQKAEFSHTASLASDYMIYKGALKQAGIELCESLELAFEKASGHKLLSNRNTRLKLSKEVFIITNAGGAGVLLSDYLSKKGFKIIEKPLDILGTATSVEYESSLSFGNSKSVNSIIVIVTPQSMTDIQNIANKIIEFKKANPKKQIISLFLGGKATKVANSILNQAKIPVFNTLDQARISLEY